MDQKTLARKTKYSRTMICLILKGLKRPGGLGAQRLARATGTTTDLWLSGTPRQLRRAYDQWAHGFEK